MTANQDSEQIRALIDQGSELSFISKEIVQRLRLNRIAASIPLRGIGGTPSGWTRGKVNVRLQSIHEPSVYCELQAYILPRLTSKIPSFNVATDSLVISQKLKLADPDYSHPGPIHFIIGSDSYGKIIKPELIRGDALVPLAQKTIFGWVLSGPVAVSDETTHVGSFHCFTDTDLQDLLIRFWNQEELPQTTNLGLNPDDTHCENHFQTTVTRDSKGRYIVRLPLKTSASLLGDSTSSALQSLHRLQKRMIGNPNYQNRYSEFIQEYQELGHMEAVAESQLETSPQFYLPHHGVLKEQSRTTKLRVVFNGSSRSSTGVSLNDILYAGPKLQTDLTNVLIWFRLHRYVFTTDIVKMFRQIKVHRNDWDLQRIFWKTPNKPIQSFHLTTVTYGLNCAPFLSLRTLQQLIKDEGYRFPLAIPPMEKGRYMDIFGGAATIKEAKTIIDQLNQLCMAGGFPLQKWNSNSSDLLIHCNNASNYTTSPVEIEPTTIKILGLLWQPTTDVFQFTSETSMSRLLTKRVVLSEVARLIDPLGFLTPFIINAKIFIQELWLIKSSWDEPLPSELQDRWRAFREQLPELQRLKIPRWLHITTPVRSVELHGFFDASQLAMSAVLYIRVVDQNGTPHVNLICAKTRVSPLKPMTIPRLELSAALLLSRLTVHVQKALDQENVPIFLWTDSSVTLTWISKHPSRWKDFVRNRVTVIQDLVPTAIWRFISGKQNPADCASRGITVCQLESHPLWWTGPPWLSKSESNWPSNQPFTSEEVNLEERSGVVMTTIHATPSEWDLLNRYSSLNRLIRITAICKRAVEKFRKINLESDSSSLTPSELQQSHHFWIKRTQEAWFSKEVKLIHQRIHLPKSNPLSRLTPFIDKFGLIRVGGRLYNSALDHNSKHPYILPRRSPLTTLLISDAHLKTLHGGTQVTLAYLRQTAWIIGGRAPVRSYILRCVRCARYRGTRAQQLMGQLPTPRVTPSRPFLHSGIDYAGPISLKTWKGRANRSYKGYLAIFVCMVTSAVHLELVTDYTTEAFIAAYKRFTGRRGICASLHSDCGTNFVGADAALRQRFEASSKEHQELRSQLANLGTMWHFNPPASPHFGGKWEAAVKSTKFHLIRTIGDSILTYEEMSTLLIQIEAILNSRPLSPLSDDSEDLAVITPGHFLIGEALNVLPEPNLVDQPISRLTRWQLLRQKVDHFWQRWSTEILQRYQAISKWHHPSNQIQKGSLVLLTDERYPPAKWPLGRVVQLHPGKDGLTRVVTLRMSSSTLKRPINKLCVLPVANT